jgi:predicted RNA binding protein YcfA (HicA-like mRNA interferase family)
MLQQQKWRKKIEVKKLNKLFEQHREKGRFKPTIPHMVKSTPVVSPRPTSDSAEVKLKEDEQLTEMPGANMDTRAVHSHLKKQGWKLTRTSGSHDVFTHPDSKEHIPVPRHKQLKAPLVLSILRTSKMTNKTRNEEVELEEGSGPKEKQKTPYRDINSPEYKSASKEHKAKMDSEEKASKGKELLKKFMKKEEVEQIDELSKTTLGNYVRKSVPDAQGAMADVQLSQTEGGFKRAMKHLAKRNTGIMRAVDRLAKEEVEIDEARLAMPLKGHAYHYKSDAELKYIQKDAHEAAQAMKGHNPKAEGKYLDQHNDASTVLHYRSKGGQQLQKEETALQRIQRLRDKREDEAREREEDIFHKPKEKKQPSKQVVQGHRYGGSKQKDDVNEESEQIDEAKVPVEHAVKAVTKVIGTQGAARFATHLRPGDEKHTTWDKVNSALKKQGIQTHHIAKIASHLRPAQYNEEVEQIDELKKTTLMTYIRKASADVGEKGYRSGVAASRNRPEEAKDLHRKEMKRQTGIVRAAGKLATGRTTNEDVEQIDEISAQTHYNYQKAARREIPALASHATSGEYKDMAQKILDRRIKGMTRSSALQLRNKMATRNEETQMTENAPSIGTHADKLKKYADEHGGIDKNSFHTAANLMKKGDHEALKKHVRSMDTDPRDKVLDHIHPQHWSKLGFKPIGSIESAVKRHNKMHGVNESLYEDEREYDYEGEMLKSDLRSIMANAQRITDMLEDNDNLPEWCQSKITLAEDYVSTVANYLTAEMNEEVIRESGGEVVWKKGGHHIEKYGEDVFALYKDGKKQKNYISIAAAKAGINEEFKELDEENKPTNPELWARAKSLAKSKFDVYPCVPLDSLAIAKSGPISYEDLNVGDEILSYNMKEDKLEWKPVLHKHFYENAPLIEIGKPTGFSVRCTPNHKWVISRENGKELVEAINLNTHMKLLMCSVLKNESSLLIENWTKKDNWIQKVLSMNEKEREIFLASSVVYDGWDKGESTKIEGRHTFGFVQKEYDHLWASLLAAYLNGYYVNSREKSEEMTSASYIRNKKFHNTQNLYKIDAGSEDVWCPTTENETWVMIQNGLITITGNSAYANGWAAKWYKEKGGSWKSVSEEVEQIDELSKDTLNSYRDKVHGSIAKKYNAGDYEGVSKRLQGLAKSGMKLAGVKMKKEEVELDEEKKPYVAVHAKHGKHETHGSTSYEAAQNAAKHWKMKNTAGISVYRADKAHSTQHVGEEIELDEGYRNVATTKTGETFKSGVHNTKEKALSQQYKMSKSGQYKKIDLKKEEVEQIDEVHAPGTKVKVPHKGKMVSGKVVRHDKGDAHGTPFYVVDVGDYESKKVSAHNVQKEETEPPFTPSKPKKDVVVGKRGEGVAKARQLARMAMQKQMKKPVKEEKQISKKAQIVKSAMKKMPDEDKFQKDPELGNTLTKNI